MVHSFETPVNVCHYTWRTSNIAADFVSCVRVVWIQVAQKTHRLIQAYVRNYLNCSSCTALLFISFHMKDKIVFSDFGIICCNGNFAR
jgi:hypothetical protein